MHVLAAALGVSAVLAGSARAFTAVRLGGAAYLLYLGVRRLAARAPGEPGRSGAGPNTARRAYRQGVVVNILNPKTALFFLAFLPQFVDPTRGPVAGQVVLLGLCFVGLGLCTDGAYALVASAAATRLRRNARFGRPRELFTGLVYVGLGVAAAVSGHGAFRPARGPGAS